MKPQTDKEWWKLFTDFCRDRFKRYLDELQLSIPDAFNMAFDDTVELRTVPYLKTRFNSVNSEAMDKWAERYNKVADELYSRDLSEIRLCEICGFPMIEGYHLAGEFACCDECCLESYHGDTTTMESDLSHAEEIDGECYWTEWESVVF